MRKKEILWGGLVGRPGRGKGGKKRCNENLTVRSGGKKRRLREFFKKKQAEIFVVENKPYQKPKKKKRGARYAPKVERSCRKSRRSPQGDEGKKTKRAG